MAEVWAVATAAVVAAGASAYGAKSASDSASAAADQNAKNIADTNQLNYQLFQQSRGSGGNSLLPLYFPSGTESALASRALQQYYANQASLGTPEQQQAAYQSIIQGLTPAANQADQTVQDLFSGALANQQVANINPVLQARGAVAGAQKQGVLEGLMQRLNAISASRARAGYSGGGSAYEKALLTGATIPALQQAGTVGAQADLANATDVANIKNAAIQTRLQNSSLPLTQAANRIQLYNLPAAATAQSNQQSLGIFDWFKLNPQSFTNQNSPVVNPIPNTGQIVGAAVGQGATALGNYYANKSLIGQLNQNNSGAGTGAGGISAQQQQNMLNEYYGNSNPNLFDAPAGFGTVDYGV